MKSSQWIAALGVLLVMVFVTVFAMNFIGGTGKSVGPVPGPVGLGDDERKLTFYDKVLPLDPDDPKTAIYRENVGGFQDFYFENPNAEDVKVGLISTGCTCTSIQIVLGTPEWKTRRAGLLAKEIVAPLQGCNALGWEPFQAHAQLLKPSADVKGLEDLERATPEMATLVPGEGQKEAVVPGKCVGWMRMVWTKDRPTMQRFRGDLWVGSPHSAMTVILEATIHSVPALRAERTDLQVGDLNETDLEKKPFEGSFRVWSATRPAVKVETVVVRPPRIGADRFDPIEVGQPVPLTLEECVALKEATPEAGTILCAYRIPVRLRGLSKDKKVAVDLGVFRRALRVVSDGDGSVEPIQLTVAGSVKGSVLIGNRQDVGRLSLGVFDSNVGSPTQNMILTGQRADVGLEVDPERTPEFLRDGVVLEKISDDVGLPRWRLRVRVKPGAARGIFPRGADAMYHDSAVYLKVKGEVVQNVRIPVEGTANER